MVQKIHFRLSLFVFILILFIFTYPVFAEIKVFEKEVEAIVGEGQAQSQVEDFAVQRAKRLAVEEAGTYLSSLSVVQNYQLQKDEVIALASGIVRAVPVGLASVREANGVTYVKIKAKIEVDTSVLDQHVKNIMKDKGLLKELEEERKQKKALEEQLANLKSTDVKRIEELNSQAIALERERDRQRLIREEQALKARGELSKLEAERIAKDREMQERINRTMAEQEKAKRDEAAELAAEQDKIKRVQLENEQHWNNLTRKSKLAQDQWTTIDDSLSLKQAMGEAKDLKKEIANLKNRLDFQYNENTKSLKVAYAQQRVLSNAKLPPTPASRDAFETTSEYNARMSAYERQVQATASDTGGTVENLKKEETLKLAEAKVAYLGQQIRVLAPFVERLKTLQARKFTLPEGGAMVITLGTPDADNNRFPLYIQHNGKSWSKWWTYTDRNAAKDFYKTRAYLKAEEFFQIEEATNISPKLVAVRVTHPGTKETREFSLETPRTFREIDQFEQFQREEESAKSFRMKSEKMLIVLDDVSGLMWAANDNGRGINWDDAKAYCENYRVGGYTNWRMPTKDELAGLVKRGKTNKYTYNSDANSIELIHLTGPWVWTSETNGSDTAYFINFNFLDVVYSRLPKISDKHVRALPVRSVK